MAEEINSLKGMLCLSFPSNQQNVSAVKGGKRCRKSSVRLILSSHQHTNIAFACLLQKSFYIIPAVTYLYYCIAHDAPLGRQKVINTKKIESL